MADEPPQTPRITPTGNPLPSAVKPTETRGQNPLPTTVKMTATFGRDNSRIEKRGS